MSPNDVNVIQLSNGNLAAVWSVDVWKELANGSWTNTSVSDVFYRVFNPTDGSFITDEIRLTNNEKSDVIEDCLVGPDLNSITFQIDNYSSIADHSHLSLKTKDYLNPGDQEVEFSVHLPNIWDLSNDHIQIREKYGEAEASYSGDTLELTVSLDVLDDMAMLKYNVDPLPLEIEIGNNNNQNLLDNLTIDDTIEFEEGHY